MKNLVLIFTALLSFIFGGDRASNACDRDIHFTDASIQCSDNDAADDKADFNDVAILPVRTATYSGESNGFAPSVRQTSPGRRIQQSTRSSFRIIKGGKVFDRNNLYTFRAALLQFPSGFRSTGRYIHSICNLLI